MILFGRRLKRLIQTLIERIASMEGEIKKMRDAVSKNTDATASAMQLIKMLAKQVRDAQDDPEQVAALADQLEQSADNLSKAVVENTPFQPSAGSTV